MSVSVVNQGISSGINFLVGIYLARTLTTFAFGIYGIGFSFVLLFSSLCNALFITQMVVTLPGREKEEQTKYVANILRMLSAFCLSFLLLIFAFLLGLDLLGVKSYPDVAVACVFAAVGYVLKDFFVRLAYSHFREMAALAINISIAACTTLGFALLYFSSISLDATSALWAYAAGQFAGAFVGALIFRWPRQAFRLSEMRIELANTWRDARWSLGGAVVIWLQTQAYVYVSAITLGPAGIGLANAARLFISPFMFLSPAINNLLLPRFSSMRKAGIDGVYARARIYSAAMIALSILYLSVVYGGFEFIRAAILGQKYPDIGPIVFAWAMLLVLQMFREGASTALQALIDFKVIFFKNTVSAAVVCFAALLLSYWLGVFGAVSSLAIGELILGSLLWRRLSMLKERDSMCVRVGVA